MGLMGGDRDLRDDGGYAMAALLVAMSVMAVMMSMALPVWTTAARREKEAELVFRGEQYARAVALFQRKYGNAIPPNLDVLINEKFLRKKYKDPITGGDFQLLTPGMPIPGQPVPGPGQQGPGRGQQGPGRGQQGPGRGQQGPAPAGGGRGVEQARVELDRVAQSVRLSTTPLGGSVIGVVSKSTERSLRLYNGRDKYNEWAFLGTQQSARAGGPGGARPGGPGGAAPGVPGRGGPAGRAGPGGRLTLPPGTRGSTPFSPGAGRRGTP